jgi:recombinational DNA repair ATPase RecF
MIRRNALAALISLPLLVLTRPAWAGSYLDRAALLLDEARREGDMLQPRTFDKELVLVVQAIAEARARAARKMEVPAAVAKAHPHLLLVLENYVRAVDAAEEGNFKKFMENLYTARDEDRNFRAIVRELGYSLPEVSAKK